MTLFVSTPKRTFILSDMSVMALTFITFFLVGRITKSVIEKLNQKQKNIDVKNPRGGSVGLDLVDDTELAHIILTCLSDHEMYLVKDPTLLELVFDMIKAKIKEESLMITPNLVRFIALKLINNEQTLLVQVGNIIASLNNRAKIIARVAGAAAMGFLGALFTCLPYAVLMMVIYFDVTENCGYDCVNYFEKIAGKDPITIYAEKPTGNLLIGNNDEARQVAIYVPSKAKEKIEMTKNGDLKTTKTYTKVIKKAKEVKFIDFQRTDPVLSRFADLEEPKVPQKKCPVSDLHDIIDINVE